MEIIDRLRKEKKVRSVFDAIIRNKEAKEAPEEKLTDFEVRELTPGGTPAVAEPAPDDEVGDEEKPLREFRTEGMHEFDMESLSASGDGALRVEYKAKVCKLIDERRVDEAIEVLKELKSKLEENEK